MDIDAEGKLLVEGTGDFAPIDETSVRAPWSEYRSHIKSARVDVQGMINASDMFNGCYALTSINLENFNTEEVTNMSRMFSGCNKLENLDLSHFDTSSVTDISNMFDYCSSLTCIDLSSFDLSNINGSNGIYRIYSIFRGCEKLNTIYTPYNLYNTLVTFRLPEGIGLEAWNDSEGTVYTELPKNKSDSILLRKEIRERKGTYENITWSINIDGHLLVEGTGDFASPLPPEETEDYRAPWSKYCEGIKSAKINVQGMTDASYMFWGCENLSDVDLSGFDTADVTNMCHMFEYCRELKTLDLSGLDTGKVTDMTWMFNSCHELTELNLGGFNTENVVNMDDMFYDCNELANIDLSSFNTKNVVGMNGMFYSCERLTNLDLGSFDTKM